MPEIFPAEIPSFQVMAQLFLLSCLLLVQLVVFLWVIRYNEINRKNGIS